MGHYVSLINGMSNAQADDFMSFATDLLDGNSGIVASGDYAVAQSSPVAMSVTVATGKAYIYISSLLSYYRTILDAAATLSIAANSSGSTRIDLICIKIDTGATPDANASNVASVVVVQGTPGGGAPATPANHYKLAEVTVASGAASIANANIADSRSQIGVRSGVKVIETSLSLSDNTTADASTTKHGLLKKLSNVATEFLNGAGNWVTAVTLTATQTLTNKTLTAPIVDIVNTTDQGSDPSAPSSGTVKVYTKGGSPFIRNNSNIRNIHLSANGNNVIYVFQAVVAMVAGSATYYEYDFPISSGIFSADCDFGIMHEADNGGFAYIAHYMREHASTTATNARFRIRRYDGAAIGTSTVRFSGLLVGPTG